MTRSFFFILILGLYVQVIAGSNPHEVKLAPVQTSLQVLVSDLDGIVLQNRISSLFFEEVMAGGQPYTRIQVPGYQKSFNSGAPELPTLNSTLEIPEGAGFDVRINSYRSTEIDLKALDYHNPLVPSQQSIRKSDTIVRFDFDEHIYSNNAFIKPVIATFEEFGKIRGRRLGRLSIQPFRYNPVTGKMIVLYDISISIVFSGSDGAATDKSYKSYYGKEFESTFRKSLNYEPPPSSHLSAPVKYVILADVQFRDALKPLVDWKTRKGYNVVELYKGEPGVGSTRETMKSVLQQMYDGATETDPAPSYLLIVGDKDQIPPYTSQSLGSHVTDLYYAEYDGEGDYLPDLYYGRFSANNVTELLPQIEKTLQYEKYALPDPSFLDEVVMIAGVDPSYAPVHGNGQVNYGNTHYFNSSLGITSHTYLYPQSGSLDAEIRDRISQGAAFVNYTGHGDIDRWIDPAFTNGHVALMTNEDMYPLMIGNGCQSANFLYNSFGETLLRADKKGALGYIGGTNDSYWDEDYYWAVGVGPILANPTYSETSLGMYDRLFHTNGEPYKDWYYTQGQMIFAGNMAVQEGNITRAKYYWEIYHLLGDPSLMTYLSTPAAGMAIFNDSIPPGVEQILVETTPLAYVSLTNDGGILDAGYADTAGVVILTFPQLASDTLEIIVTGQQLQPFLDSIIVTELSQPYISVSEIIINDSAGIPNGKLDYGEEIMLGIEITNLGMLQGDDIQVKLRSIDSLISVIDSIAIVGQLQAGGSTVLSDSFSIQIDPGVTNLHEARLEVVITEDATGTTLHLFDYILYAPDLKILSVSISDSLNGNLNNRLDAGESAQAIVRLMNQGGSPIYNIDASFQESQDFLTVENPAKSIDSLPEGSSIDLTYEIDINPIVPADTAGRFTFQAEGGMYSAEIEVIKPIDIIYDDFETGTLVSLPWKNDTNYPWMVTGQDRHEGRYAIRSGEVSDGQGTSFEITMYVEGNDSIGFHRKVSSENNFDFLRFYIDNNQVAYWSGESDWTWESFPVDAGLHTFRWRYTKDNNTDHGQDRAWLDFIELPSGAYRVLDSLIIDDAGGNGDSRANPGELLDLNPRFKNPGITGSNLVSGLLTSYDTLCQVTDTLFQWPGTIEVTDIFLTGQFAGALNPGIPDQSSIPLVFQLTDSTRGRWKYYHMLDIEAPALSIIGVTLNDSSGNNNGKLDPYESIRIEVLLRNDGHADGNNIIGSLTILDSQDGLVNMVDSTWTIDTLAQGDSIRATFIISMTGEPEMATIIPMNINIGYPYFGISRIIYKPFGYYYEDFEKEEFLEFPWINDSQQPWIITNQEPGEGRFSAMSPDIGDGDSSSLSIRIFTQSRDTLVFRKRVSSEVNYDFLKFYIDDSIVGNWSGQVSWSEERMVIPPGYHTLRWTYRKDINTTQGEDRAWIDFIIFPEATAWLNSVGITSLVSPQDGPFLGAFEEIQVLIKNHGVVPMDSIPVEYRVDQGTATRDTLFTELLPGESILFVFDSTYDFSGYGDYTLEINTAYPGDTTFTDDSITVTITHYQHYDIALVALLLPVNDSMYNDNETISVRIMNTGNQEISNIPIAFRLGSDEAVMEIIPGPLSQGDSLEYTFLQPVDLSEPGLYDLWIYTGFPEDQNPDNDTIYAVLYNNINILQDNSFEKADLGIYPVPFIDYFSLSYQSHQDQIALVSLWTMDGKKLFEKEWHMVSGNNSSTLYLSSLERGIYLLHFKTGDSQGWYRVIKH